MVSPTEGSDAVPFPDAADEDSFPEASEEAGSVCAAEDDSLSAWLSAEELSSACSQVSSVVSSDLLSCTCPVLPLPRPVA